MSTRTLDSIEDIQNEVILGRYDFREFGEVYTKISSCDNFILFNYLPTAVFDNNWTFVERVSRGLIINRKSGEVAARPFDKFFNYGQAQSFPEPNSSVTGVYEKVDGSLGISYLDKDDKIAFSTRGSFESDQAVWATEFWHKNFTNLIIPENWTLLVEIVYPENRIVVDYKGWEGLVVLGARDKYTGEYILYDNIQEWYDDYCQYKGNTSGLRLVKRFNEMNALIHVQNAVDKFTDHNDEGFVVEFSDGSRFKFKGEEYLIAHRLISNMTEKSIHESLVNRTSREIKEALPDEFHEEYDKVSKSIFGYCNIFFDAVSDAYHEIVNSNDICSRKEFALAVQCGKYPSAFFPWLFMIDDGVDIDTIQDRVLEKYFKIKESGYQIKPTEVIDK